MVNREFFKERRGELALTCADVASALGYESRNGYWRIEAGLTKLTAEQLFILAGLFQTDMRSFFTETGEKHE